MATHPSALTPLFLAILLLIASTVVATSLFATSETNPAMLYVAAGDLTGIGGFDLNSTFGRRLLQSQGYVSYDALQGDRVPCSRRSASYYNCRPDAQANHYDRGCSAITQCRR
ncbi:protein RALF-like 33 [Canna indica]|uniref:Protein RALF-like 33 n=1 Tax=Canna indica TaxID=4628 RepID=A0AAQ3K1U0_9LILI|nr:protein RALF-like 33 [Canna indica]